MRTKPDHPALIAGATLAAALLVAGTLNALTGGFARLTTEDWRRHAVAESPVAVPAVRGLDDLGAVLAIGGPRTKAMAITFIYTRCPSICYSLGATSSQLAQQIDRLGLADQVAVVSASFDPRHDGPPEAAAFKARMERVPSSWRVAVFDDERQLSVLMDTLGVVAVDDGFGGYDHNAAIHLINPKGELVAILDVDDVDGARQWLVRIAQGATSL